MTDVTMDLCLRANTPAPFDGATFATVEAGVAHADEVGFDAITDRRVDAAQGHADLLREAVDGATGQ